MSVLSATTAAAWLLHHSLLWGGALLRRWTWDVLRHGPWLLLRHRSWLLLRSGPVLRLRLWSRLLLRGWPDLLLRSGTRHGLRLWTVLLPIGLSWVRTRHGLRLRLFRPRLLLRHRAHLGLAGLLRPDDLRAVSGLHWLARANLWLLWLPRLYGGLCRTHIGLARLTGTHLRPRGLDLRLSRLGRPDLWLAGLTGSYLWLSGLIRLAGAELSLCGHGAGDGSLDGTLHSGVGCDWARRGDHGGA